MSIEAIVILVKEFVKSGSITPENRSILDQMARSDGLTKEALDAMIQSELTRVISGVSRESSGFVTAGSGEREQSASGFATSSPQPSPGVSGFTSPQGGGNSDTGSSGFSTSNPNAGSWPTSPLGAASSSGTSFNERFTNVEELKDQGAMSIMMKGKWRGKWVCIKRVKPECRQDPRSIELFYKEFENAFYLDHQNIVKMLDKGVDEQGEYYWMEYYDGTTLTKLIDKGRMDEAIVKRIALQILDALEYIHQKQIFHRDLKPDNIFILHKGNNVRILDFGLAAADSFEDIKGASFVGTRRYAAPEQHGDPSKVDGRADIYAFGLILLEMLVGRIDDTKNASKKIPEVRVVYFRDIIEKCLKKNPDQRYNNCLEIIDYINSKTSGSQVQSAVPQSGVALGKSTMLTAGPVDYRTLLDFVKPDGVLQPAPMQKVKELKQDLASVFEFVRYWDNTSRAETIEDDQLAQDIRGETYAKTKKRIDEFETAEKRKLDNEYRKVQEKKNQLDDDHAELKKNDPGSPPSKAFVNSSDPAAVSRYNAKLSEYNHQVQVYNRIQDKVSAANDRYEETLRRYEDKVSDFEDQLQNKKKELVPALDEDISTLVFDLSRRVTDLLKTEGDPYASFLHAYFSMELSQFLLLRVQNTRKQADVKEYLRKMNSAVEEVVFDPENQIQFQFGSMICYLEECKQENAEIQSIIASRMAVLPYELCSKQRPGIESLLGLEINVNFKFAHVIDPEELSRIEKNIAARKAELEGKKKESDDLASELMPIFSGIEDILSSSKVDLARMFSNYASKVADIIGDFRYLLRVFEDDVMRKLFGRFTKYLTEIRKNIETLFSIQVFEFLDEISESEMLALSTQGVIDSDAAFNFLPFREQLKEKSTQFYETIDQLAKMLIDISKQPEKKSKEFGQKSFRLMLASLVPGISAVFSVMLHLEITKLMPGFRSNNTHYVATRNKTSKKLRQFFIIHTVLGVLLFALPLFLREDLYFILFGSQLISSIFFSLNEFRLKKLDRPKKQ